MEDFLCENCGNNKYQNKLVQQTFNLEGRLVLVENIPAKVCTRCGEPTFSRETAEHTRLIVNGNSKPIRNITTEVYEFA